MGGDRYTAKQFIDAIPGTGGIVSVLARRIGCDWWTAKRYITKYPTVKAAYEAECETVTDLAESVLLTSIKEGNTQDAKWWLARIRRDKFGDSLDVTSGGEQIKSYVNISPDDWEDGDSD